MKILAIALNPTIDISSDVAHIMPTHKMRTTNQRQHAGGGGVNVARVITMFASRPELLILSGGATGRLLEHTLAELPLDLHAVPITQMTRVAFMVYERETGLEYRFVPDGPAVSAAEITAALDVVRNFKGEFVIASGSLPKDAPQDIYAEMARIADANGAKFVLDTSGPALGATLDHAPVFLVKPSLSELQTLTGRSLEKHEIEDAALDLVRQGRSRYVVATLGADGAVLAGPEGALRLPAADVKVQSAVGAGDSFVGALVWYLAQGKSMDEAFRFGMAAGAAATINPGTELCHPDDVYSIFEGRYRPQ